MGVSEAVELGNKSDETVWLASDSAKFVVGAVVRARHPVDNDWYLATVSAQHPDETYLLDWFDGDPTHRVRQRSDMRLMRFDAELECYQEDTLPSPKDHP